MSNYHFAKRAKQLQYTVKNSTRQRHEGDAVNAYRGRTPSARRRNRLSRRACMPARLGYNAWFVVLDGIPILLAEGLESADPESYRELMVEAADTRETADTGGQ